jgi:hypothetical protein
LLTGAATLEIAKHANQIMRRSERPRVFCEHDKKIRRSPMKKIVPCLVAAAFVSISASAALAQAKATITKVENDGREITIKTADGKEEKVSVSGSRTKITVKGAAGDRAALKVGMACVATPASGEAATIVCD